MRFRFLAAVHSSAHLCDVRAACGRELHRLAQLVTVAGQRIDAACAAWRGRQAAQTTASAMKAVQGQHSVARLETQGGSDR